MQIVEIIDVGPGWNKVRLADGNIYTLDGNYSWRSNNPGNIEYGDFAKSLGAIGEGAVPAGRKRGFAIFPTLEAGQRAREVLQFESPSYLNADTNERWGHSYPDGSIGAAIYRYAPPTENDTEGYIRAVTSAAGVPPETMMRDLTPEQRGAFMEAQQHHEGWRQGDVFNEAGVKLPPAEIPNVVGTKLDTTPAPIADRANAALDNLRPIPAPRSQGIAARVNASFDQPRPASMSPELAAQRSAAPDVAMPRPRPAHERAAPTPAPASQRPEQPAAQTGGERRQRLLPIIGPTGNTKVDPVGTMPSRADVAGLGRPPSQPVPSGGLVERRPAPRSVTRTGGIAGTAQMAPGARPQVADQLVREAEMAAKGQRPVPSGGLVERAPSPSRPTQVQTAPAKPPATAMDRLNGAPDRVELARNGQSYAGQDRALPTPPARLHGATPTDRPQSFAGQEAAPPGSWKSANVGSRPEQVARVRADIGGGAPAASAAEVPKYITTSKQVPLGDTVKHTSRDSVAATAAGRKLAESEAMRTIRTTTLNPAWVEQQRQQQVASAPGIGSGPAAPGGRGLGQGAPAAPQIIYGSATGRAYEVGKEYSNGNGSAIAQADGTFKRVGSSSSSSASSPSEPTATVRRSSKSKDEPTLLERIRTGIGLPAEGIGPSVQRALGITGSKSGSGRSAPVRPGRGSSSPGGASSSSGKSSNQRVYNPDTAQWD